MQLTTEQKQAIQAQKEQCPFCNIIAGKIPAQKVYEDDLLIAVLDINPARPGHVLLMPKEHYPIVPLLPPETFDHFFSTVPQVSHHLRKAMLAKYTSVFLANGAAAGQQSVHFLAHIIPSDKPLSNFSPPSVTHNSEKLQQVSKMLSNNLPLMLKQFAAELAQESAPTPESSIRLAELIEENPDFKEMLISNPQAVLDGLEDNPSLKPLFENVDVFALSAQLQPEAPSPSEDVADVTPQVSPSSDPTPRAIDLSDSELRVFLDEKQRLKELLLTDIDGLKEAIPLQEKLQVFFSGTSPEDVRARVKTFSSSGSLEDLAGGGSHEGL